MFSTLFDRTLKNRLFASDVLLLNPS